MLRSITPKRATTCLAASVDPTDAREKTADACDELFTLLDDSVMPADNNGTERDIRSLAAARTDGGTHRADWRRRRSPGSRA
jgi:hypothetical protein